MQNTPLKQVITALWQKKVGWLYCLLPVSWIYRLVVFLRRTWYRIFPAQSLNTPVIVVGNITVGGTGKTPLVIALVHWLKEQGYVPGVVSRGYGSQPKSAPVNVDVNSRPEEVGDEPLLIYQQTNCSVVVFPDRVAAAKELIKQGCTIIVSDDGLQHYRLHRNIEIAVIDGQRRLGNEWCLPAGPLREPVSRLKTVDFIVTNGQAQANKYGMQLKSEAAYSLAELNKTQPLSSWQNQTVHAVAGIGNPRRFFDQLTSAGIEIIPHVFNDHHAYGANELDFSDDLAIFMTEKDAIKCREFANDKMWCIPVKAVLKDDFWRALGQKLSSTP